MRSFIRSNPLRLAILLWFACWLLLVIPGHRRGIVQLPDSQASVQQSCCKPKPSCCPGKDQTPACPDDKPAKPDPAKNCAICFLKARLTDPPPLTLYTPYLGEMDELAFLLEESIFGALAAPSQLRGRAPPA